LNGWRKLLLTTVGAMAVVGPITVGLLNGPPLRAQSAATEISSTPFASASVKANTSADPRPHNMMIGPGGTFAAKNTTLRRLMTNVYGLLPISGGPNWFGTDRFDIEAQVEGNPSRQQMYAMVRRLLVDRFNLIAHTETRLVPVYTLVVAKAGTLGPRIRPSTCTGKDTVVLPPGPLDPRLAPPLPCGGTRGRPTGRLEARWQTMEELAQGLSPIVGRKVLDRTGLTGKFDLEAEWVPAPGPPGPAALGVGPATFTALEEQLGLRLDSETGPVDTLVIDNLDRPVVDQ
jgi:uncharacterized protein (TIGR03435 family)